MQNVMSVDEAVEDFEQRQKPPFISLPGLENTDRLTQQQQRGIRAIFDTHPENFADCMLIHQYAEPLQLIDAVRMSKEDQWGVEARVRRGNETTSDEGEIIMVRPGAVFDDATSRGSELHFGTSMMANLEGISNPVQVIPHGAVAHWRSKWRVPIAGWLCMPQGASDSAPVLTTLPTPCVPTTLDAGGNPLDPSIDDFEVFIGNTRVTFPNKTTAEDFCQGYAHEIANDIGTMVWDAEDVKGALEDPTQWTAGAGTQAHRKHSHHHVFLEEGEESQEATAENNEEGEETGSEESGSSEEGEGEESGSEETSGEEAAQGEEASESEDSEENSEDDDDEQDDDEDAKRAAAARAAAARDMESGGKDEAKRPEDIATQGDDMKSLQSVHWPSLANFISMTRKRATPEGWTMGTKNLLVVIMDWKAGDRSLSPYSQQMVNAVAHYQNTIFPKVQQKFLEMSYGQFSVQVTFVPEVIRYVRNRNQMPGRLPFPVLYDEAMKAVQGRAGMEKYAFRKYDLVYVIHPQVQPIGTKGVAWVGSRGASCNGCETISDNFKVMVAVHELGHNLGLSHASSNALEYGNPFDWMGNYPDVVGLHYGLGYSAALNWVSSDYILEVSDSTVNAVNDMVTLSAFDQAKPQPGQVFGIKISLSDNREDIWVSFRSALASDKRGVYVVYQSKESPDSKLMDAACTSASQQDARLREGWTFMDGTQTVVLHVKEQTDSAAKVHVYRTPRQANSVAGIRARELFTDGRTKCPPTCQDMDLLISQSCAELKQKGYCESGVMTLRGQRMPVGTQVCPQTCGKCKEAMAGGTGGTKQDCADRNIVISGMDCGQIAANDYCELKTTSGMDVGEDLCPQSCGLCPVPPPAANPAFKDQFPDPEPARSVGDPQGLSGSEASQEAASDAAASSTAYPWATTSPPWQPCQDDVYFRDPAGYGCDVYANTIPSWGKEKVCFKHRGGIGSLHCRATCGTCKNMAGMEASQKNVCADNTCIGPWMEAFGRCYQCQEYSKECTSPKYKAVFEAECPVTCGVCQPDVAQLVAAGPAVTEAESKQCDDETGDFCTQNGEAYCSENYFALRCKKTCGLCPPAGAPKPGACINQFSQYTCSRYLQYGWCDREDTRDAVRLQCPQTCGTCNEAHGVFKPDVPDPEPEAPEAPVKSEVPKQLRKPLPQLPNRTDSDKRPAGEEHGVLEPEERSAAYGRQLPLQFALTLLLGTLSCMLATASRP